MSVEDLPTLNACLNGISAVLIASGLVCVKRGKVEAHKRFMIAALSSSTLFLASYLLYHYQVGSVKYPGEGTARTIYLLILLTHVVLAVVIVPLVIVTVQYALRQKLEKHKKWARVTWPIWLYVSVTGVVIYLMLASTGAYEA